MISLVLLLSCCASLFSAPMVTKVKINSSLLGKDRYLQHYLHEPGDTFDQEAHERSLQLLHTALTDQGYLSAEVSGELFPDRQRNTIAVTLSFEPGERYIISEVAVEVPANEPLSKELTSFLEGPLVGSYAEKDLIDQQGKRLRSLLLRKGYIAPQIGLTKQKIDTHLRLTYQVQLDKRNEYTFLGNQFITTEQLLDEVYALEEQGISLPPSLITQELIDLYTQQGFASVSVHSKEEPAKTIFFITEGPRYTIGTVTIKDEFTDADALQRLDALERSISSLPAYDKDELERLLQQASDDLALLGFWYVVFDKQVTQADHAPKLNIELHAVQPDGYARTVIHAIEIPGHEALADREPFAQWQNAISRPLTPHEVDVQRRWLLRYMREQGYLLTTVTYTIDKGVLTWHIDTSQGPTRFGPIAITGLHKMKPRMVTRELCFKEGDIWNKQKIEESVKRLKALRMFESIAICPEQQGPVQPITIKCSEDDPFELRTRFGLQFVSKSFTNLSWSTWKLGGSFIWKNPSGYADRLILDADWTRYTLNVAGSYETPWIGPFPIRSLMKVYNERFEQPLVSSQHTRLYTESHTGALVQLQHGHPWWTTSLIWGAEVNKVSGIRRELAQAIDFEPQLVDRRVPYLYVEPSVTFENFDNKTDPTKGYFTTLCLKGMFPPTIKDGWFIRALLEQSFFYPLHKHLIGALRWRFGHIFNAKFSTILPTQRFYLGGANSLRGYETNMAPPLESVVCDGKKLFVPVGGKTMANVNAELRFPVYKRLSGVVFTDMGILVQDRIADIEADHWLGASGFGLRFASPIGPIRFDIGWKWKKREEDDKRYAFFFTFGHAF